MEQTNRKLDTYLSLCAEFYDLDKPSADDESLALYLKYAESCTGLILEPMCGTGRYLIPLLERGFAIEGFDASNHMLGILQRKCAQKVLNPKITHQFLHEMNQVEKYALIIIPSGSIGLIADYEQLKQGLKKLHDGLTENGTLVFEVEIIHKPLQDGVDLGVWKGRAVRRQNGAMIALSTLSSFHHNVMETLCRYELIHGNQVMRSEIELLKVRFFDQDELDPILKGIGFSRIKQIKQFKVSDVGMNSEVIIYECSK